MQESLADAAYLTAARDPSPRPRRRLMPAPGSHLFGRRRHLSSCFRCKRPDMTLRFIDHRPAIEIGCDPGSAMVANHSAPGRTRRRRAVSDAHFKATSSFARVRMWSARSTDRSHPLMASGIAASASALGASLLRRRVTDLSQSDSADFAAHSASCRVHNQWRGSVIRPW